MNVYKERIISEKENNIYSYLSHRILDKTDFNFLVFILMFVENSL